MVKQKIKRNKYQTTQINSEMDDWGDVTGQQVSMRLLFSITNLITSKLLKVSVSLRKIKQF